MAKKNSWYHPTLINASRWLRENNEYFRCYYNRGNILGPPIIIPTATLSNLYDELMTTQIHILI